ncbi:hypothetical protein [Lancefieldella parvula]|uniref:hypothetical protein n=1 Tax=Lancefieldella parvula TaxID=1382 RepID=UPI0028D3DE75|nr:hypothetical protein [Lancefieldella parvula]
MLTKEERTAIADRLRGTFYITNSTLFKALTGEEELIENDQVRELCVIARVIFELCDTSNMLELPVDKDGEVIRIGDTVYDSDGDEYKVTGYKTLFEYTNIFLSNGSEPVYATVLAHYVTHKQPVTIGVLVERIKNVMNDDSTTVWAYDELDDIATQLEHLGDNDE